MVLTMVGHVAFIGHGSLHSYAHRALRAGNQTSSKLLWHLNHAIFYGPIWCAEDEEEKSSVDSETGLSLLPFGKLKYICYFPILEIYLQFTYWYPIIISFEKGPHDILAISYFLYSRFNVSGSTVETFQLFTVIYGNLVCCPIVYSECLAYYVGHPVYELTALDSLW